MARSAAQETGQGTDLATQTQAGLPAGMENFDSSD